MSRSRWVVLLGPPLVVAIAAGAGAAVARQAAGIRAGALPLPRPVTACSGAANGLPDAAGRASGTWWRTVPVLDAAGGLAGWTLTAGAPGGRSVRLGLPAASAASGPDRGRVIVATDDGARSSIHVVDVAAGCERVIDIGHDVARTAVADFAGDGVLVHLVSRGSRADLGTWLVTPDGRRSRVLEPVAEEPLHAAGIERVWVTSLATSRDGRLGVQSCDPEACLTRVLERTSGRVTTLAGGEGDLIGFAGDRLITWAACHGRPCGVLAWGADGSAQTIADTAIGAAALADGLVVIATADGKGGATALAIDPSSRAARALGPLARDSLPLSGGTAWSGIETGSDSVGLGNPSGLPSILEVQP